MEIQDIGNYSAIPLLFDGISETVILENPDTLQKVPCTLHILQNLPARIVKGDVFQVFVGDSMGNGKIWMNADKRLFNPSDLFEFELIYGVFQFITADTIIIDRLDVFEFASKFRVLEIEDGVNESAIAGSYDSYAYRSAFTSKATLKFLNYVDLKSFEEFHSNYFIGQLIK